MILALLSALLGLASGAGNPQMDSLPNGMTIAWFPNTRVPLVDLVLWVPRGERDDLAGKYGTSRLLSDLIEDQGQDLEALGATVSSSAGSDSLTTAVHGLAQDVDAFLNFLKESVTSLKATPADFQSQKERVRDELTHLEDRSSTLAVLVFQHQVTRGTPYHRGPLVGRKDIDKIQYADMQAWMKKNYLPEGAVLLVAGQADRAALLPKITATFANWKGTAPARVKPNPQKKDAPAQTYVVHRAQLNQAQMMMGFRGPLYASPDRFALAIANALFGEYFNSRLNMLVRDQLGLTYAIGSQWTFNQDLGVFSISASTENNSVGTAVSKIQSELKNFAAGTVTAEELESARNYLIGSHYLRTDSVHAFAAHWLSLRAFGVPKDLEEYEAGLKTVTLESLQKAVRKHFKPQALITVLAGDSGPIQKSLAVAKIKSVKVQLQGLN